MATPRYYFQIIGFVTTPTRGLGFRCLQKFLEDLVREMKEEKASTIFLAGDSSLDNKYWFNEQARAVNGFERILNPPTMKLDVCYWLTGMTVLLAINSRIDSLFFLSRLNLEALQRKESLWCVNTAVEATSLNSRPFCSLLPQVFVWFIFHLQTAIKKCIRLLQDEFIRDTISEDDVLIVSIGGNDIALSPLLCTILNISMLICCTPQCCLVYLFVLPAVSFFCSFFNSSKEFVAK